MFPSLPALLLSFSVSYCISLKKKRTHECFTISHTTTLRYCAPAAAAALNMSVHQLCESSRGEMQAAAEERETVRTATITQVPSPYHSSDMGPAISVYPCSTLRMRAGLSSLRNQPSAWDRHKQNQARAHVQTNTGTQINTRICKVLDTSVKFLLQYNLTAVQFQQSSKRWYLMGHHSHRLLCNIIWVFEVTTLTFKAVSRHFQI